MQKKMRHDEPLTHMDENINLIEEEDSLLSDKMLLKKPNRK